MWHPTSSANPKSASGEMLVVSFVKRKTSEKFQLEPEKKRDLGLPKSHR